MPQFSQTSLDRLNTCHPKLIELFTEVVKHFDCTVLEGHRGEEAQNKAFSEGKSQLRYPNGNHNATPSLAVDVAPWPVDWKDRERFLYFGGFVMGMAKVLGIPLRWGGDWNMNNETKDNKFSDLVHFQLEDK